MKKFASVAAVSVLMLAACASEQKPVSQKVLDYYTNPPAPKPEPDLVTIIGDSYTGGSKMGGNGASNWVARVQMTTNANLDNKGVGGTGYATPGAFTERVASSIGPATDLVVFVGSRNDIANSPATVGAAAKSAYEEVKRIAPDAQLLVIGPVWGGTEVPSLMLDVRDAVKDAATAAGATWVDPIEQEWFLVPDQQALIGEDGVHPTDEGHAFLASAIGPLIQGQLTQ